MSVIRYVQGLYLAYLSKPASHRSLYRAVRKAPIRSIVQLGLGDASLALNLIWLAQQKSAERIRFTGVDLFELRPNPSTGLSLKDAHQKLSATGARIKLAPGDPLAALARHANSLVNTDLLVIAGDQDATALGQAWFYIPRMLTPETLVFQQHGRATEASFEPVSRSEIDRRAVDGYPQGRRAA